MTGDGLAATVEAVEAVWRIEAGKLIAGLARVIGDVNRAEDLAQDALVAAMEQWPRAGIPDNPAAWLMTTAKRRDIDQLRRRVNLEGKLRTVAAGQRTTDDFDTEVDERVDAGELAPAPGTDDDLLLLLFSACQPALAMESRVALVLRCLGGLSTPEIARAFLLPEATVAQRIVRAKRTLDQHAVDWRRPEPTELAERLASEMEVVYLIFNEGYSATGGADWTRPDLCREALRLAALLRRVAPAEPEVHGLAALLELQASRLPARVDEERRPVLLADQDRRRWDRLRIRRGLEALSTAESVARSTGRPIGPYVLQAGIAACHARAHDDPGTDWARIADLYSLLAGVWPSPVVELNRAVALSKARGPGPALEVVDRLVADGGLDRYPHLWAVRGDLLAQVGRADEAADSFTRAAALTDNQSERDLFLGRATTPG